MSYVKLKYNGRSYDYNGGDSITMDTIGQFLSSDIGCYGGIYKEWALNPDSLNANGNLIAVEKDESGYIHLTDMYNQNTESGLISLHTDQFVQLLDDWQEKVCKHRPKEVTITYTNNQCRIETTL